MKPFNAKTVPPYHPQVIVNTRKFKFLERVTANGVAEARELTRCAELLEAIADGHYTFSDPGTPAEPAWPAGGCPDDVNVRSWQEG
jgi:hypothetical protein